MECDIYSIVDVPAAPTQCHLCSDVIFHCLICTSPTKCINCMVGWLVAGGCTNVSKCISVVQNYSTKISMCTECYQGFVLNNNSLCSCPTGYWIVTSYCTNIIGCIVTKFIDSQVVCSACDLSKKLSLTNSICECMPGFYINSTGKCLEICGDGKVFYEQCDDGNTINGDGCSSICKIESQYICFNGSQTHKSNCVYNGQDFSITLKWIDKTNGQNQGIFAFTVNPPFLSLSQLNLTDNLYF